MKIIWDSDHWMVRKRVLFLAVLLAVAGCGRSGQEKPETNTPAPTGPVNKNLPKGTVEISGDKTPTKWKVEIAEDDRSVTIGLMNRPTLGKNAGMVFLFDEPTRSPFYMKNTLIPLDIAFWNASMTIVDIQQMTPCKADPCRLYDPKDEYIGALEVNLNALSKDGIKIGDKVTLTR